MRLLLALGLLWLTAASAAAADDPPTRWMLAVADQRADGVALVNGVPMHRFASAATKQPTSTASLSLAPWLVNGRNRIEIRVAKLGAGGSVGARVIKSEAQLMDGDMQPVEAGKPLVIELDVDGLPRWRFLDATPMGGDEAGLRRAVAALHASVAKADTKAMMAARKPFFDDLSQIYGAPPPDLEQQLAAELKRGKLRPLPSQLSVSTAHDGKLAIVETADGTAPIRADAKDGQMEIGKYWAKLDGTWLMVR